jgi:hypothetical protein
MPFTIQVEAGTKPGNLKQITKSGIHSSNLRHFPIFAAKLKN